MSSKQREYQDFMDKIILEKLSKCNIRWSDLLKSVSATCHPFATYGRFTSRMKYLMRKGYIERVTRGLYRVTKKGHKYMELL